jgi:hypothetical protein
MRSRFFFILMIICMLFLSAVPPQSRAATEPADILNRQKAVLLVRENSSALMDSIHNENIARKNYEAQVNKSKTIDTEKVFLFRNPYTDEDVYYYYRPEEQMQMRLLKEFVPEQVKYAWELRKISGKVTENALANTADNLFIGLYSAHQNVLLAEKSLELAKKAYLREKARYDSGLITELDLESCFLDLREAENALVKSERNYENIHRQFNMLAGLPVDYRFKLIGTPWTNKNRISISEDEAVASALANRMEIWDLERQIRLIMQQMEIYRHKDVHRYHQNTKKDYEKATERMEELKLKLSETKYNIEKEIRQAYKDLEISYLDMEISKERLLKQKKQLDTITDQYNSGLVPASVMEQMEMSISQLEFAANMSMITVLNKSDKFFRAISTGPGY